MTSSFMDASEFFQQVERYFRYLFDMYDFAVATEEAPGYADIAEVVLNARTWSAVIYREHVYVNIMVGPIQTEKRKLYDLGHVITFLDGSSETDAMWFGYEVDISKDYSSLMLAQLNWWSNILRENCDRLAKLFNEHVFLIEQPALEAWIEQVEMAIRHHLSSRFAGD